VSVHTFTRQVINRRTKDGLIDILYNKEGKLSYAIEKANDELGNSYKINKPHRGIQHSGLALV